MCWVETGLNQGIIILYSASEQGYLVLALYKHTLLLLLLDVYSRNVYSREVYIKDIYPR